VTDFSVANVRRAIAFEFDCQANIESNTAIAIRIVAAVTAQAQGSQAYCSLSRQE